MLKIVDLPTPFGPSNPQISPSLIVREILSRICLLLKDKEIFLSSILGLSSFKFSYIKFFNYAHFIYI